MKHSLLIFSVFLFAFGMLLSANQNEILPVLYDRHDIGHPWPAFSFKTTDLPAGCKVKISGYFKDMKEAFSTYSIVSGDGSLVNEQGKKTFLVVNCSYGQKMVVTISPHPPLPYSKKYGLLFFIPHPLEAVDEYGHRLTMEMSNLEGTEFMLHLSGFKPGEVVQFKSVSCHEIMNYDLTTDEKGELKMGYLPAVASTKEGPFKISISNQTTDLFLQHYWGKAALTPPTEYSKLKNKFLQFFK